MKWQIPAYTFKATGTETTLSFTSTTRGSFGPAVDNVTVTETLAPGADCKKGGWKTMFDSAGTSSGTRATASATTRPARRTSPSNP